MVEDEVEVVNRFECLKDQFTKNGIELGCNLDGFEIRRGGKHSVSFSTLDDVLIYLMGYEAGSQEENYTPFVTDEEREEKKHSDNIWQGGYHVDTYHQSFD